MSVFLFHKYYNILIRHINVQMSKTMSLEINEYILGLHFSIQEHGAIKFTMIVDCLMKNS